MSAAEKIIKSWTRNFKREGAYFNFLESCENPPINNIIIVF